MIKLQKDLQIYKNIIDEQAEVLQTVAMNIANIHGTITSRQDTMETMFLSIFKSLARHVQDDATVKVIDDLQAKFDQRSVTITQPDHHPTKKSRVGFDKSYYDPLTYDQKANSDDKDSLQETMEL